MPGAASKTPPVCEVHTGGAGQVGIVSGTASYSPYLFCTGSTNQEVSQGSKEQYAQQVITSTAQCLY